MTAAGIPAHYVPHDLAERVLGALRDAGHNVDRLGPEALVTLEDFHLGGRATTARLADLADIRPGMHVLDMGCGIGGPARFLAQRGCQVTGVDLTADFVLLARELNARTGLADQIDIREADATALPFADAMFDVAWTQHVAMNIADKAAFYGEARRVLRPGGRLAMFDVVAGDGGPIHLPVPWASSADQNFLLSASELATVVDGADFSVSVWEDATDELMPAVAAVTRAAAGDGPKLTAALYVPDAATRFANTHRNLQEGRTRLLYGVAMAV